MRDSTIFYRSFFEAIDDLPEKNQVEVYRAIFNYTLNFKEPDLTGISATIFKLIRPQLDANNKRYENGNKAKVKQKESETEANNKQNGSKTEANKNENKNQNENVNENQNLNQNSGLPAFVADDADAFFPDLLWQLKIHHDTKCPIELREEIAKKKNGYIMLVQKIPLWNEKKKYLNIPEAQIQKLLVEWLSFNSKNKAEVSWKNYAEMAQHAFNFIDKKIKNQNNGQNSQHAIAPASTEQNRPADKSWFGKL